MNTSEALSQMNKEEFLQKIYHYAYGKCNTSFEAEDLCSDIILAVIRAVQKQEEIEHFYGFVWTIARRVYADYCEKRSKQPDTSNWEDMEATLTTKENAIEAFIEEDANTQQLKMIFREIAFLSKIYRDVMILYYLDGLSIKEIALRLQISENTVKQRLFSARSTVKNEVEHMEQKKDLTLKPIRLAFIGTGNPVGNEACLKAERLLSQNLIYLCKDKPRSVKELSEELHVPMPFIEEELDIQCKGQNGTYGMLRKLDNDKYITNILLVDTEEYEQANQIYAKHLPEFCAQLKRALEEYREQILNFPYLSKQNDLSFILWGMISQIIHDFSQRVQLTVAHKYFKDVTPISDRPYTCVVIAHAADTTPDFGFYGRDDTSASDLDGNSFIRLSNTYGRRLDAHFHCGHNISQDPQQRMLLKSVEQGLSIASLSASEKEIAAKALEAGYLRKNGELLEPNIVVLDINDGRDFYNIATDLTQNMQELVNTIAEELAEYTRKHIPEHLLNEYPYYISLIAGMRIYDLVIEECIRQGLLKEPEKRIGAEGVVLFVEKTPAP